MGDFWTEGETYEDFADYAKMNIYYEYWSKDKNTLDPVADRPCTPEDFGLVHTEGVEQTLYQAEERQRNLFTRKMSVLRCLEEPLELIGNWDTEVTNLAQIYLESCDPEERSTCKSDSEVKDWMKNKYMFLVFNKKTLKNNEFGDKSFTETSYMLKLPLDRHNTNMNMFDVRLEYLDSSNHWLP